MSPNHCTREGWHLGREGPLRGGAQRTEKGGPGRRARPRDTSQRALPEGQRKLRPRLQIQQGKERLNTECNLISNKIISNVTAAVAGRNLSVADWTTARDQAGKLEVLLTHLKNLGKERCATALIERLAGQNTKRHLAGRSVKQEVAQIIEEGK